MHWGFIQRTVVTGNSKKIPPTRSLFFSKPHKKMSFSAGEKSTAKICFILLAIHCEKFPSNFSEDAWIFSVALKNFWGRTHIFSIIFPIFFGEKMHPKQSPTTKTAASPTTPNGQRPQEASAPGPGASTWEPCPPVMRRRVKVYNLMKSVRPRDVKFHGETLDVLLWETLGPVFWCDFSLETMFDDDDLDVFFR